MWRVNVSRIRVACKRRVSPTDRKYASWSTRANSGTAGPDRSMALKISPHATQVRVRRSVRICRSVNADPPHPEHREGVGMEVEEAVIV
jgi:hypothetical protein